MCDDMRRWSIAFFLPLSRLFQVASLCLLSQNHLLETKIQTPQQLSGSKAGTWKALINVLSKLSQAVYNYLIRINNSKLGGVPEKQLCGCEYVYCLSLAG